MAEIKAFDFVGPQQKDPIKCHMSWDGQGRVEYVYTTKPDALHGDPCLVTRYSYVGLTGQLQFFKEYIGTWDSAWDLF